MSYASTFSSPQPSKPGRRRKARWLRYVLWLGGVALLLLAWRLLPMLLALAGEENRSSLLMAAPQTLWNQVVRVSNTSQTGDIEGEYLLNGQFVAKVQLNTQIQKAGWKFRGEGNHNVFYRKNGQALHMTCNQKHSSYELCQVYTYNRPEYPLEQRPKINDMFDE